MMRLLVNSLAASAGGGLTYIRNLLPQLAARSDVQATVLLTPLRLEDFRALPNIEIKELQIPAARRFFYEQSVLPRLIGQCGAEVLLSTGNFALRRSPVPQILLSRNSIYTSADYYRDLRSRGDYRAWLDTRLRSVLARRSIHWADVTIAPSQAFAAELTRWTGAPVMAVYHGFDRGAFMRNLDPLSPAVEAKLQAVQGCFKLLFVSHYNYFRNFETLIRALPFLRGGVQGRPIKLLLTCRLMAGENPGAYRPEAAAELITSLGVSDVIVELGAIDYRHLHQIYAQADAYVTPAYTETFAHPLVEAMASGVPVIASDIAVHREICGDAAVYFPRFASQQLSEAVLQIACSPEAMRRMAAAGLKRSGQFSWKTHVEKILELCAQLIAGRNSNSRAQIAGSSDSFHANPE